MCNQVQCTIPVSSCSEQRDEQKKKDGSDRDALALA